MQSKTMAHPTPALPKSARAWTAPALWRFVRARCHQDRRESGGGLPHSKTLARPAWRSSLASLLLCGLLLPACLLADDSFTLVSSHVSAGGTTFQSAGGYEVSGTVGLPAAGVQNRPSMTAQGGFWTFLLPASVPTTDGPIADLAVLLLKSADPVLVNTDFICTLVVTNRGPATATNVWLTYTMPAGATLVSAASLRRLSVTPTQVLCDVGIVHVGACVELELVLRSAAPGLFLNTAAVALPQLDPLPLDNAVAAVNTFASGPPRFFNWNNGANGDFLNPLNWTPNDGPPSFGDTASISSGSATLNGTASIGTLNLSGGELAGNGSFTVGLGLNWSGGTMSGAGATAIPPGVPLTLSGAAQKTLSQRTLNNGGTLTWTGTGLLAAFGTLNNLAGALFDIQTDAALDPVSGLAASLNNAGTLRKSAGLGPQLLMANVTNTGTMEFLSGPVTLRAGALHNHGLIRAAGGNVTFRPGGTNSGTFEAVSPSYTYFEQGRHELLNGARLIGSGFHYVGSLAVANVTGEVGAERLALQTGGTLGGPGTLIVTNTFNWTGGTMMDAGVTTILPGGALNLSGTAQKTLNNRTLNNGGTMTWTGTGVIQAYANLNNLAGALFDIQTDAALDPVSGLAASLNNAGTLRKSAGPGPQLLMANVTNTGTMEFLSGPVTLRAGALHNHGLIRAAGGNVTFRPGGTNSGTFEAVSPSYTYFEQGTHELLNGARLTGSGFHYVGSLAVANVTGEVGAERLALQTGGTLGGPGTLTVTNTFNWTGGTMNGDGVTTILLGSALNLSGTAQKTLNTRTLNNGGTLTWTGTGEVQAYSTLNNLAGALFDIQTDAPWNRSSGLALTFNNAGTVRKSVTTGTTSFQVNIANTGTLDVSSGILSLNGTYAPSASARTRFTIGGAAAGTGYGRLVASGALTLAGQLDLVLANGFAPADGAAFAVLSGASRSGTFTTTTGRGAGGGLFFKPTYLATGMNLVVADGTPQFSFGAPGFVSGQFQMRFGGAVGENYRVDASTDLKNWTTLATTAMPGAGFLDFADAESPTLPRRFYRVNLAP